MAPMEAITIIVLPCVAAAGTIFVGHLIEQRAERRRRAAEADRLAVRLMEAKQAVKDAMISRSTTYTYVDPSPVALNLPDPEPTSWRDIGDTPSRSWDSSPSTD